MFRLRTTLASTLILGAGVFAFIAFAANPPSGTITTSTVTPVTWTGTATGIPPAAGGESTCVEGSSCDSYVLTISGTPADWVAAGKQVHVQISWLSPGTDYDMYIHKGSLAGPTVASSGSGGTTQEQVDLNPASSSIGTGVFVVHVVYFLSNPADQYNGAASVITAGAPPIPAPTPTFGLPPRYENFNPPAAGPATLGRSSGEPSIGVGRPIAGHPEGRAMFQSDVQTLRVTFNGCVRPLWENKPTPFAAQDFDPISFTDRQTGRTIISLLSFAGDPIAPQLSYTDTAAPFNDGDVYVASEGVRFLSGIDHQTVGVGPFAPPLDFRPPPLYPNAVYYCSQGLAFASCARSDDGGQSFLDAVAVPAYTDQCGGLHGHVKVAPDGTVYLPNKGCGTAQAVVVSENNGLNWTIRPIPGSVSGSSDPSVGTGSSGRVYFGYADGDTKAAITTSTNKGVTWTQPLDVGAALGINNVVFPAVVAGDNDRAAFAFLGTPTAGGLQGPRFTGIWHLYVATTYDGGATWTTVDATPNDAVQRGCIWLAGGANVCRNMLDFMDVQMDQEGRVLVGFADGCTGGECIQAGPNSTGNAYTALAAITRQSGGRRLIATFDPPGAGTALTAPGTPFLSAQRNGNVVHLSWSEADNGGSAITGYNILRSTIAGSETQFATVGGSVLRYDDATATDTAATYFYKVVAINGQGASCGDNEVSVAYRGQSNTGDGFIVAVDPTADGGAAANPDLDVQTLSVLEPSTGPNAGKIVFNLKVTSLALIPNSRMWRIVWNTPTSPTTQFYVGMTKDATGVITYDYGTVLTTTVGLVLGVPTTTRVGNPDAGSFTTDGLITIAVSKDKIGNVRTGDLLGGISVRTYATVTDQIRSTNAIDTTSNATASDNTANAFTYALVGPIPGLNSAVSRKTHGTAGTFDIDLPLAGTPGVECRTGGATGVHQIVFNFANSGITVSGNPQATVSSGSGTVTGVTTAGNTVTVDLNGVPDVQTIAVTLNNVSYGTGTGNITVSMGVLAGDTTGNRVVNSTDISQTKAISGQPFGAANFRNDVTINGAINSSDISLIKTKSGNFLP